MTIKMLPELPPLKDKINVIFYILKSFILRDVKKPPTCLDKFLTNKFAQSWHFFFYIYN